MAKSRNKRKGGKKKPPVTRKPKSSTAAPPMPDRRTMERVLSSLSLGDEAPPDNEGRAQELIYDAWENRVPKRRVAMARQALELWPDCADAWVLVAEHDAASLEQAGEYYRQGVEAGERALGRRAFKEDVGHFWGLLETRPYMRARSGYAQVLERLGRKDEAVMHYRDMLRLNPGDNQGIRYLLLRLLLNMGRDDDAWQLLEDSCDEPTAEWSYAKALVAFRRGDDAAGLLRYAFQRNAHVPDYLLGRRRLPRQAPDYIGFGDETEAGAYALEYLSLWQQTPGAREWLRESWKAK